MKPEGSRAERLCSGFRFIEGPVWHPHEQCLYFNDIPGDTRYRWSERDGVVVLRSPSNKANGMTLDRLGRFLVCEHDTSLVVREARDGTRTALASDWRGLQLNSPNDVVERSDGMVFFTDPTYGRKDGFGKTRPQQLDMQPVFAIATGGTLVLAASGFDQPNGLCFSPDESILYVNDTPRAEVIAFDCLPDGTTRNRRVFASGIGDGQFAGGIVDGMKCDVEGNLYVTGPGGIWIYSADGRRLGVLELPERAGNMNWGGEDWSDLYCTCSTSLYRIAMQTRGCPAPYMQMPR